MSNPEFCLSLESQQLFWPSTSWPQ